MRYAVVRIRSPRRKDRTQNETFRHLRLTRVNHCTVIPDRPEYKGMIKHVQHSVTWGEIDDYTLSRLLKERSTILDGLTDEVVSEQTKFEGVDEFSKALLKGDAEFSDIDGLENRFKLHPPKGGFKGVKKVYKNGGSLGYRGQDINQLIEKMFGPEVK